jgi:hypothetical protein
MACKLGHLRHRVPNLRALALAGLAACSMARSQVPDVAKTEPREAKANHFNDPFSHATGGIADCPVPEGPEITLAEMLAQSHGRSERGTSCYQAGRCRLPNAYLYDQDIIARAVKAIDQDGRFGDTSVWLLGQRRWVWLKGCVRSAGQAQELERLVGSLDDVEAVVNELTVWAKPASGR